MRSRVETVETKKANDHLQSRLVIGLDPFMIRKSNTVRGHHQTLIIEKVLGVVLNFILIRFLYVCTHTHTQVCVAGDFST